MRTQVVAKIEQWRDGSYGATVGGLPREGAELSADDLETLARQLLVAANQIKDASMAGQRRSV